LNQSKGNVSIDAMSLFY